MPLFTDKLTKTRTTWKAWYAVFAPLALILGSQLPFFTQFLSSFLFAESLQNFFLTIATPIQFIGFVCIALLFIRIVSRTWPTTEDLGLTATIRPKDLALLLVVFLVTHLFFKILFLGETGGKAQAVQLFEDLGLKNGLPYAIAMVTSSVVLAPVCEELLYRGIILRAIHDGLARKIPLPLAVFASLLVSSVLFAMPHLSDSLFNKIALAYLVSGLAFSFVYIQTGSLTAAMVSHSLQSCYAFATVLLYGKGSTSVSPAIYLLVFGCPLWTYCCARALYVLFPKHSSR
ncbi:MAG: type II CAAX endopeptidase family protein [bacterium]|nr:type II CAAX endopeptidase family protein [bacterium]